MTLGYRLCYMCAHIKGCGCEVNVKLCVICVENAVTVDVVVAQCWVIVRHFVHTIILIAFLPG